MSFLPQAKPSPWFKPAESEFAPLFRDAFEYRAEHDRESYMRELAETMVLDFDSNIDWSLPPIGKTLGATYALYLKNYVSWCEEVGIRAIVADPFFFAQYLRELSEEGFTDLHGVREAVRRAHWLQGHGDGTAHPRVDAVIEKFATKDTEQMAYEDKNKQGITKNGEKLPTRKELEVDPPSKVGFWDKDIGTASGQDDLAPNFTNPHGGKSRGQ